MYKLDERRAMGTVTIQLQLPDNSRTSGSFEPTVNLQLMLGEYRARPDRFVRGVERFEYVRVFQYDRGLR